MKTYAVSLKGRYLAGGFPGGFVKIWEVADQMECAGIQSYSSVVHFCWLGLEQHLAVTEEALVSIWDIGTRKVLHRFKICNPACSSVYSQELNRLAVLTASVDGGTITLISLRDNKQSSFTILQLLTCFAFSQTMQDLVCGMKAPRLGWFGASPQSSGGFDLPTTTLSLSILSNGTTVVNTVDSGIQFLRLDKESTSSRPLVVPVLSVQPFDEGRLLSPMSLNYDSIILLGLTSVLLAIPVRETTRISENRTVILCASDENSSVIHCFKERGKEKLQMWKFYGRRPEWTVEIDASVSTSNGPLLLIFLRVRIYVYYIRSYLFYHKVVSI